MAILNSISGNTCTFSDSEAFACSRKEKIADAFLAPLKFFIPKATNYIISRNSLKCIKITDQKKISHILNRKIVVRKVALSIIFSPILVASLVIAIPGFILKKIDEKTNSTLKNRKELINNWKNKKSLKEQLKRFSIFQLREEKNSVEFDLIKLQKRISLGFISFSSSELALLRKECHGLYQQQKKINEKIKGYYHLLLQYRVAKAFYGSLVKRFTEKHP